MLPLFYQSMRSEPVFHGMSTEILVFQYSNGEQGLNEKRDSLCNKQMNNQAYFIFARIDLVIRSLAFSRSRIKTTNLGHYVSRYAPIKGLG